MLYYFGVPKVSTTLIPCLATHQRHLEKSKSVCRKFRQLLYHVFRLIRDISKNPLRCAESFDNFDTTSSDSSETSRKIHVGVPQVSTTVIPCLETHQRHVGVPKVSAAFISRLQTHQKHLKQSTSVCRKFRHLLFYAVSALGDRLETSRRLGEAFRNKFRTITISVPR